MEQMSQLRVIVGVQIGGVVTTGPSTKTHNCTIKKVKDGFDVEHNGQRKFIPFGNVTEATYEPLVASVKAVKQS